VKIFEGSDACVSPVLGLSEAAEHPHNKARGTFTDVDGLVQNAPAPRFSRSRPDLPRRATRPGSDTRKVLKEAGIDGDRIQALADGGVIPSET
jgi:alpha-methylacyl-CoA racemase